MDFIAFYCLYGLLWLLSRLPVRILYFISDLIFPFFYYLIPYRKAIVKRNISASFPTWEKRKVNRTVRKFYSYLIDSMMESIMFAFKPENEMIKRFAYRNPEVCNELYNKGKSILLLMGHYGNWEWCATMPLYLKHEVLAIYKPLHNQYYDRFIKRNREKYGVVTIPTDKTLRIMTDYHSKKLPILTMFLADQRPRLAQIQHWINFLNQDTPVILGPEKIAKRLDEAVVFFNVIPVKRGYYEVWFDLLSENPNETGLHEITERYFSRLEEMIIEHPSYWLWSHKRWRHKREDFDKLRLKN